MMISTFVFYNLDFSKVVKAFILLLSRRGYFGTWEHSFLAVVISFCNLQTGYKKR